MWMLLKDTLGMSWRFPSDSPRAWTDEPNQLRGRWNRIDSSMINDGVEGKRRRARRGQSLIKKSAAIWFHSHATVKSKSGHLPFSILLSILSHFAFSTDKSLQRPNWRRNGAPRYSVPIARRRSWISSLSLPIFTATLSLFERRLLNCWSSSASYSSHSKFSHSKFLYGPLLQSSRKCSFYCYTLLPPALVSDALGFYRDSGATSSWSSTFDSSPTSSSPITTIPRKVPRCISSPMTTVSFAILLLGDFAQQNRWDWSWWIIYNQ